MLSARAARGLISTVGEWMNTQTTRGVRKAGSSALDRTSCSRSPASCRELGWGCARTRRGEFDDSHLDLILTRKLEKSSSSTLSCRNLWPRMTAAPCAAKYVTSRETGATALLLNTRSEPSTRSNAGFACLLALALLIGRMSNSLDPKVSQSSGYDGEISAP